MIPGVDQLSCLFLLIICAFLRCIFQIQNTFVLNLQNFASLTATRSEEQKMNMKLAWLVCNVKRTYAA